MTLIDIAHALQSWLPWAPAWLISLVLVTGALALALLFYEFVVRAVVRNLAVRSPFWSPLLVRTKGPVRLALLIAALSWAVGAAPFTTGQTTAVRHGLLIAFIVLWGWAALIAADISAKVYLRRWRVDVDDNLTARKHQTQMRILQRAAEVMVIVVTVATALMTLPGVKQLGVSLLAAGGAAGLIVGLALQPILSNLMAGVQLAFTQPIRLDDAVKVEGQVGHVEEITGTYVVIRLWDRRRLVVPLKYFFEKPFENWTRESAALSGEVLLQVDYRVPIPELRAELMRVLEATPAWDRRVGKLQAYDSLESVMVVRCLVSARNAQALADLRFEVREAMIGFLQARFPEALPRKGVEFAAPPEPPGEESAGQRDAAE
jgi:small-conductance mechanosensitive channel